MIGGNSRTLDSKAMISIETKDNCTIFRATGTVTANEIMTRAVQYLTGEQTETSMWDFSRTTRLNITTLEMKGIADSLKHVSTQKRGGKVALVGSSTINVGLGKLFSAFAQMAGLPFRYKSFHRLGQAEAWLADDSA